MIDKDFTALFHVLSSEQQILQRTDQKAFTILSILGVFMVFFMIHFTKMEFNWFIFIMTIIYFLSALMTIIQLVLVIVPRVRKDKFNTKKRPENPTFFAGIAKFPHLKAMLLIFRKYLVIRIRSISCLPLKFSPLEKSTNTRISH